MDEGAIEGNPNSSDDGVYVIMQSRLRQIAGASLYGDKDIRDEIETDLIDSIPEIQKFYHAEFMQLLMEARQALQIYIPSIRSKRNYEDFNEG
jgi:hypothetical protein